MSDDDERTAARARLAVAGASAGDLAWLNEIGWNAAGAGPIRDEAQVEDYRRRESLLNASVAHLSYVERGASVEGRLAAELGARLADWRERGDTED